MNTKVKQTPKPGRPRSERARLAILEAAQELLETKGLTGVTMEGIAERASVGKPTVYRHWPNAQAVAMAALMHSHSDATDKQSVRSGLKGLRRQLKELGALFASPLGRSITLMVASADHNTEIAKVFRNHFVLARREEGRRYLEEAIAAEDLRADLDVEITLDLIYAPIFYRLMIGHQALSATSMTRSLDQLLAGLNRPDTAKHRATEELQK
ncbi:MAG: TetR/AcrR family transcriptional regulator [Pseudomonadota bacterium]